MFEYFVYMVLIFPYSNYLPSITKYGIRKRGIKQLSKTSNSLMSMTRTELQWKENRRKGEIMEMERQNII